MPLHWKLVIDCADPHRQAAFWAAALDYTVEDHSALIDRLLAAGAAGPDLVTEVGGRHAWRTLAAVRHPEDPHDPATDTGLGRRLLFQQVPEPKQGKNRLHLDVHPEPGTRDDAVERLRALGATVLTRVDEPAGSWVVMQDPEGNEFCVH
ncbi:VOC family protein [Kitasatospora sp. NPDC058201]|uniref:VOC family protein n=1 Tax=Streptomycetaceae TaxID=2062 RepID=UPI002E778823|nr:VOC family protein [Streptomyces sp. BE303]MED7955367.1 VOC family protein [Streptomyces sp. BE303]